MNRGQEFAGKTAFPLREYLGSLRYDLPASIVVFLVAIPLCMGIAIASGVPVAAGLITGIVGGLVVGMLAGCPLQVSGPAAGLTVIVYDMVQQYGLEMLGAAVLVGGMIQLLAGSFGLGQWFRAVSPAVIRGMLSGIGVIIFASQFHVMVDAEPRGSALNNLLTIPEAVQQGLPLPEWTPAEERSFKAEKIRQFGALHQRQQDLQQRLAQIIPRDPSAASERRAPEELQPYIEDQQAIVTDLDDAVTSLNQATSTLENGGSWKSVHAQAEDALEKSRAALAALQQGDLSEIETTQAETASALSETLGSLKNYRWAAKVGLLTLVTIVLWQVFLAKKIKVIPGHLVAVVLATAGAAVLHLPVLYVEVPDRLLDALMPPTSTVLQDYSLLTLLQCGFVIAAIASAETLLCATAVDQMQSGPRTQYNRELCAQGVGNMICGFLGALPMTGVIVRSSTNVQAGGRTRMSAFLHGVWLLLFVAVLGFLLRMVPTASLAGILVYVGYKLINPKTILQLWEYGKGEAAIYVATVGTIVVQDLLTGILTGIILSAIKLLYTVSHLRTDLKIEPDPDGDQAVLSLEGAATFLRLPKLAAELERVPKGAELHVELQHLDYVDHACLDLLMNWAKQHESLGGHLIIDWDSLHARFKREAPIPAPKTQAPARQPTSVS